MKRYILDILVSRGGITESRHRVHAVVSDERGTWCAGSGDPETFTCWRSCAKPFQLLAFLGSGRDAAMEWGSEQIALACASHGGEPEHVSLAAGMLASVELEEGDLACGPHEPLSRRGARMLREAGERPTRLHNNCSGKHAAMLAFARAASWPVLGYQSPMHPVQQRALETVAEWTAVPSHDLVQSVDGCGVVAFGLPLHSMARAFARLGAAATRGEELPARIIGAMREHPFLVGGTDRFDTLLIEETNGRVIAKVGAEGVHSVMIPDAGLGIAVKVEDGAARAQHPAVLRILQHLGALPDDLPARLASFLRTPVQNTRGEIVGEVEPAE
jgi:L-asparaginase II